MTTKEAIARLKAIVFDHTDDTAINVVINALLASQKRERDMSKRLSPSCEQGLRGKCYFYGNLRWVNCISRNCPLLKEKR